MLFASQSQQGSLVSLEQLKQQSQGGSKEWAEITIVNVGRTFILFLRDSF